MILGTKLGPYEILAPIGKGGMGEVYRARDTKLNRDVAIKVLPAAFANDPNRMARFQREAHVLASLNHPHIATIYGLEESGQYQALVMELVEGPTLADRIHAGPIPEDEAFEIARQIAEALEYAHEHSIIHRDLKPANVKVTPDGSVKLLDFGLAKALEGDQASGAVQDSPTITMESTRAGVILGTAAYMAPEQAKGKQVDRRADIWAYGVVLFEMLTGKQLYTGDTSAEVLASVMKDEPKLDALSPKARYIVQRCLRKEPRQRWQAVGDVRLEIEESAISEAGPTPAPFGHPRLWITACSVLLLALIALAVAYIRKPTDQPRVVKLFLPPPEKALFTHDSRPAISPDGRKLAFVASVDSKTSLWVRDMDSLAARALPGTEGGSSPFWSPDSRSIAFFVSGALKKIDASGGSVLSLCNLSLGFNGYSGTWSKNSVILLTTGSFSPILRVPAEGGSPIAVTTLDSNLREVLHFSPSFFPDGNHFLYSALSSDPKNTAIYVADLNSQTRRRVLAANSNVAYARPGYLLFVREHTLMAQPFDASKAQLTGDPISLAEQVGGWEDFGAYDALFSTSQDGILVYGGARTANLELTWFDRSGRALATIGKQDNIRFPIISPDGSFVALERLDPQTHRFDIWLVNLRQSTANRFTFNSRHNLSPVWSPDGRKIVFASYGDSDSFLYQKAFSGDGKEEILIPASNNPSDWSPDGRYIVYGATGDHFQIWVLPLFGDRKPFRYSQTQSNETDGRISPNGRWLAYFSDETQRNEVYVQSFPVPGSKHQVSSNGGMSPVWSRDGKELFFIGADRKMMVAEVRAGAEFEAGSPKPLFDAQTTVSDWFDVSKDGRFLIPVPVEQYVNTPMTVIVNWPAALKR